MFAMVLMVSSVSVPLQSVSAESIPECNGLFQSSNGDSYVTIQTNAATPTRSIQWSFRINSNVQADYGSTVRVNMTSASVNDVSINPPYAAHEESPDYNFHGSLSRYQPISTGQASSLREGDVLYFFIRGNAIENTNNTSVALTCQVS